MIKREKDRAFTMRAGLHLSEELDSEIEEEVKRTGIPKAVLIRTILMHWLHTRKNKFVPSSGSEGHAEVGWL